MKPILRKTQSLVHIILTASIFLDNIAFSMRKKMYQVRDLKRATIVVWMNRIMQHTRYIIIETQQLHKIEWQILENLSHLSSHNKNRNGLPKLQRGIERKSKVTEYAEMAT